ncbi:MAG: site-specific DNA-methyltransferase [Elusimicrobia bacterium]|nr:site-specific DNA-methyltransferase [Elusimicrobiota bacterium]
MAFPTAQKSAVQTRGQALPASRWFLEFLKSPKSSRGDELFSEQIQPRLSEWNASGQKIPVFTGEFWTSRQRQGSSLHEISYRACFKPQLPRFFIERLTCAGDRVYDPFLGRGTTAVEAALLGRNPIGNDVNPLSEILTRPRLRIPSLDEVSERLASIPLEEKCRAEIDLTMFYHPRTESEIVSLKKYLQQRASEGSEDDIDRWIRMVATNRLTGHSSGFFSVYTLPPNQATSPEDQKRINEKRGQKPEYRNVRDIILKKTRSLRKDLTPEQISALGAASRRAQFTCRDAGKVQEIPSCSVRLTVTSPPFLDVVEYSKDNWLRGWFNGIDAKLIGSKITMSRTAEQWTGTMTKVFHELFRVTADGGYVAFEVGEVRKATLKLEDCVVPAGLAAGFHCLAIMVNEQRFTKTSNIWGVGNNALGTNTNRIVIFRKGRG